MNYYMIIKKYYFIEKNYNYPQYRLLEPKNLTGIIMVGKYLDTHVAKRPSTAL